MADDSTQQPPQKTPVQIELDNLRAMPSEATVSISQILKILELLAG